MSAISGRERSAFLESVEGLGPFLLSFAGEVDLPPYSPDLVRARLGILALSLNTATRLHSLAPRQGEEPVVIGRSANHSDVVLECKIVSKRHAELLRPTTRWRLKDLESANGTFVEERRLPAGVAVVVQSGQTLKFTEQACVFLAPEDLHSLVTLSQQTTAATVLTNAEQLEQQAAAVSEAPPANRGREPAPVPSRTTRRRVTGRLGVPTNGVQYQSFARRVGLKSQAEFEAEFPGPFLVELRQGALENAPPLSDGIQPRLDAVEFSSGLQYARVHSLAPLKGDEVLIGRARCDVELGSNETSRRHAKLVFSAEEWRIEDVGSANGTWVEGNRLLPEFPTRVSSGQIIGFGEYRTILLSAGHLHSLVYRGGRQVTRNTQRVNQLSELLATPPEGVKLRDLVGQVAGYKQRPFLENCVACFLMQIPVDHEPLPQEATPGVDEAGMTQSLSQSRILSLKRSQQISDAIVHTILPLPDGSPLQVGREEGSSDIILGDASVSKNHAELTQGPSGWQLVDLGSNNGTFVEGERLHTGLLVDLKGGLSLRFSSYMAAWLTPPMVWELAEQVRASRRRRRGR